MATTIRELLVSLGVDADDATDNAKKLDGALSDLKGVMVAVVGTAAAVTAAISAIAISAANAGDEIAKGAERTGVSVEEYQRLRFAAEQSGVAVEQLEAALGKQALALADVSEQGSKAQQAYSDLGLTAADLQGLDAGEAFKLTADALAGVTDEAERTRIATDLYGESARQLLPLINAGSEGIDAYGDTLAEMGVILDEGATDSAVLFNDTLNELRTIVSGVKNAIGLQLLPVLTALMQGLRDWYTANQGIIQQRLQQAVALIVAGIESLARMVEFVDGIVQSVFGGWGPVLAAAAAAAAAVGAAIAALGALQAWSAISSALAVIGTVGAATFGQVALAIAGAVAAIVALYLVIDDLIVYFRGGDSALGRFLDRFREADGPLGAAARLIERIGPLLQRLGTLAQALGGIWWEVFSRTTLPALKLLGAAVMFLAEVGFGALGWYWDNVVGPALDGMIAALDWLIALIEQAGPLLDNLLSAADGALDLVGGALGLDLTIGAAGDSQGLLSDSDLSAGFAPTAGEVAGGTSSSSTTSTNVEGNTYNITGVGMSEDGVNDLIDQREQQRARETAAAIGGSEV